MRNYLVMLTSFFIVLFGCNETIIDNSLTTNEGFSKKLEIKTQKSEYKMGEDFNNNFAAVSATVFNTSSDTFYANLGDGFSDGVDQDNLLMAEGTDGYFELFVAKNSWEQLPRGILIEGSKVVRILPSKLYTLQGTAYLNSDSVGKFRLRINYYKTYSRSNTDTLKDISNTFFIYEK